MNDKMGVMEHIYLSVLFFQERPGVWIAQGLERDIAAQGRTQEEARKAFEQTALGYLHLDAQLERSPLSTLGPAPEVFWKAWHRIAETKSLTARPLRAPDPGTPPAFVVDAITNEALPALSH